MKKVLMVASVASMIDLFNMNNIQILQDLGYTVEVACNFQNGSITSGERVKVFKQELQERNVKYYDIPIPRSIAKVKDIYSSYSSLKKIINDNKYKLIHCHSPIGGAIARIAARRKRKLNSLKVVYTAHGFHFFKGAKYKNWIIYYPVEKILSSITDCLITINEEDFHLATNKLYAKDVRFIPGIGIDSEAFYNGYDKMKHDSSTFNLISIGQLSKRKNHEIVIRSIARMNNPLINYKIIGIGELESYLKNLVEELGLQNQVSFLGFQENVAKYLSESDCFVFPSLQEGLPVSLMEAMAIPLPVICSKIRGNTDLIENMRGGILVEPSDEEEYIKAIMMLFENRRLCYEYSKFNLWKIKEFDKNVVNKKMVDLYKDILI